MPQIKDRIITLKGVADRCDQTLRTVSKTAKAANSLSTGALFGSIGFFVGSCVAFVGCVTTTLFPYMPFIVPAGAAIGVLIGIVVTRDGLDRENERASDLVSRAWQLRDQDVLKLDEQIERLGPTGHGTVFLAQKRAALMIASPEQLLSYYGFRDRRDRARAASTLDIGPSEKTLLEGWPSPNVGAIEP